jgi:hypothetical protein
MKQFEELQIMKFTWQQDITDLAAWNSAQVKEVDLDEYSELLEVDKQTAEVDKQTAEWESQFVTNEVILKEE